LLESLKKLASFFDETSLPNICVLCTRYTQVDPLNPLNLLSDTQTCVGRKRAKYWNEEIKEFEKERFTTTCRNALRDKLRICNVKKPHCVSHTKTPLRFDVAEELKDLKSLTQIFAVKVSECWTIPEFESHKHSEDVKRHYKSAEHFPTEKKKATMKGGRMGCIVWGRLEECLYLLTRYQWIQRIQRIQSYGLPCKSSP
jgi:hypothetical protein